MASAIVAFNSPSQPTESSRRSLNNSQSGTVRPMPLYGRRTSSLPSSPRLTGPNSHREQCQRPGSKAATTANISTIGHRPGNNNNRVNTPMSFNHDQSIRGVHSKIPSSRTPHHIVQSRQMPVDEETSAWAEDEPNYYTSKELLLTNNNTRCENKMAKSQSEQGRKPRAERRRTPVTGITRKDSHHPVLSESEFPPCESCSQREVSEQECVIQDENGADTKTQSMSSVRQQATNSANALRQLLGEREIKVDGRSDVSPTNVYHSSSNEQAQSPGLGRKRATQRKGSDVKSKWKGSNMFAVDVTETGSNRALKKDLKADRGGIESVLTGARKTISAHERSEAEHRTTPKLREATSKSPQQPSDARPASSTIGRFDCTSCEIGYCDSIYHRPAVLDPSFNDITKRTSQNSLNSSKLQSDLVKVGHLADVRPSNYRAVQITKVARVSESEQKRKDKSSSPASYQPAKKYARTSDTLNKEDTPNCPTQATGEDCAVEITDAEPPQSKICWAKSNKKMKKPVTNHIVPKILMPSPEKPKDQGPGFSVRKSTIDPWLQKKIAVSPKVLRPTKTSKLARYVSPAETAKINYQIRKNYQPPLPHSALQSVKSKEQDTKKMEVQTPRSTLSRHTYTNSMGSNTSFKSASSPPAKASFTRSELQEQKNSSEWLPLSARSIAKPSRIPGPFDSPRAPVVLKHESGRSSFRPISPVSVSDTTSDRTRIPHLIKPTTHRYRAPSPTDTFNGSECESSVLGRQIWMLSGGDDEENDRGHLTDSSRRIKSKTCTVNSRIKPDTGPVHNTNSTNSRIPLSSARTPRLDMKKISKLPVPKILTDGCLCSPRIRTILPGVNGPATHQMVPVEPFEPDRCEISSDRSASQKGTSRMQQKLSAQEQAAKIRQRIYDQELAARKYIEQDQEFCVVKNPERSTTDQDEKSIKQNLDPEFLAREKQKHFAQEQAGKMRQRIFDQGQAASLRREAISKEQAQKKLTENIVAEHKLNTETDIQELSFELTTISQTGLNEPNIITNEVVSRPIPAPRTSKKLICLEPEMNIQPENDYEVVTKGIKYDIPFEKQTSKIPSPRSNIKEPMAAKRIKNLKVDQSKKLSLGIMNHEQPVKTSTVSLASTANTESTRRSNRISNDGRPTRIPSRSPSADHTVSNSTVLDAKGPMEAPCRPIAHERSRIIPLKSRNSDKEDELPINVQSTEEEYRPPRMQSKSPDQSRATRIPSRSPDNERRTRIPSLSPGGEHLKRITSKHTDRPTRIESTSSDHGGSIVEGLFEEVSAGISRSVAVSSTRIPSRSPSRQFPLVGILSKGSQVGILSKGSQVGILSNTSQDSLRIRSASRSPISFRTKPKKIEIDPPTTITDEKDAPLSLEQGGRSLSSTKTHSDHDISSSLIVVVNRPQSTSSAYIPSFITVATSKSVSSKVGFGGRGRFYGSGGSEQNSWATRRKIDSDPSVSIGTRSTSSDEHNPAIQVIARPVDANCYIPAFFKVAEPTATVPRKFGDMKSLERMFVSTSHEKDPKDRFQMFTKGHWTEIMPLNQSCTSPTSTGNGFSFYGNEAGTQTEDNRYASCLSASRLITTEAELLGTQKTQTKEDQGTIGASVMQIWSKNREMPINLSGDNRDSNATWSKRLLTKTLYFKTDSPKELTNEEQKRVKSSSVRKPDFSLKDKHELTLSNILLARKRAGLATMTSVGELMADFVARKNRSTTSHRSEKNETEKRAGNKSNVNNVQQHVEYKVSPAVVRDTKTVQFSLNKKHSKGGSATFKDCAVQRADDGEDRVRIVTLRRKDRFSRPRDNQPWTNKNDN